MGQMYCVARLSRAESRYDELSSIRNDCEWHFACNRSIVLFSTLFGSFINRWLCVSTNFPRLNLSSIIPLHRKVISKWPVWTKFNPFARYLLSGGKDRFPEKNDLNFFRYFFSIIHAMWKFLLCTHSHCSSSLLRINHHKERRPRHCLLYTLMDWSIILVVALMLQVVANRGATNN